MQICPFSQSPFSPQSAELALALLSVCGSDAQPARPRRAKAAETKTTEAAWWRMRFTSASSGPTLRQWDFRRAAHGSDQDVRFPHAALYRNAQRS